MRKNTKIINALLILLGIASVAVPAIALAFLSKNAFTSVIEEIIK